MTDSDLPEANPAPAEHQALPLEELAFTPQWVKSAEKSYTDHAGAEPQRKGEGRQHAGRERNRGPRREQGPPWDRPAGAAERRESRPERHFSGRPHVSGKDHHPPPAHAPQTLPVEIAFQAEEKGFAAMMETMKQSPRAYALFDVAKLVLNKPERHHVKFVHKPAPDGIRPPLFLVMPSESVFLRQDEAVRFAMRHHAEMIYREKKTPIEPPKGNFTFVNRCGITGVWLGPPNYHEYQSRLVRHHQQRLRHMPFEEFRSRIQTVKDPEAIKVWMDSMSFKMEYECILDAEPKQFATRDELERHFVENHLAQFVTAAPEVRMSGVASRQLHNPALLELLRLTWLQERKFPMNTANEIRGKLRHGGFHFFKAPKGITYISHIKPQRFESIAHLSEQIQKIILFLREHSGCKRKRLLAHFFPPTPTAVAVPDASATTTQPVAAEETSPAAAPSSAVSNEEERFLADLHWLIQDGYVVEFSDGRLWALPDKPPQPIPVAKPAPTAAPEATTTVPTESTSAPTTAETSEAVPPSPPPVSPSAEMPTQSASPPAPEGPTPNPPDSAS